MRILIVTDLYPPHFVGGYELKCKLHAEELARRGHDVSILTSTWRDGKEDVLEDNVSRLLHTGRDSQPLHLQKMLPIPSSLCKRYDQLKRMFASRKNYRVAHNAIVAMNPDLVYAWQLDDVTIGPVVAAQDQGIPTVFRLDDYWLANLKKEICLDSNPLKRRYRAMINGLQDFNSIDFSHMLVVSRSVKKSYVEVGFLAQNITVMPEGVSSDIILGIDNLPNPTAKDYFRMVYVGRLVHQKGTHVVLEALEHLIGEMGISNIRLDIIGVGPSDYIEKLKNMTVKLGLKAYVEFVGFVEHQHVLARFLEYNAVLIPSLWEEPLSGTIAEAMARGLPVIATDRGGNPEIIFDGENGLLANLFDIEEIAAKGIQVLKDPAAYRPLGRAAEAMIAERYSLEAVLPKMLAMYERAIETRRSQPLKPESQIDDASQGSVLRTPFRG